MVFLFCVVSFCCRGSQDPCGLKYLMISKLCLLPAGRGSQDPCGLKSLTAGSGFQSRRSRVARPLWVEILDSGANVYLLLSRVARPLWVEILRLPCCLQTPDRRGSQDPCGLKFIKLRNQQEYRKSRVARPLWVEISTYTVGVYLSVVEGRKTLVG